MRCSCVTRRRSVQRFCESPESMKTP